MSTHIHLALIAGRLPPRSFYHPVHTGFARWINDRRREQSPRPDRRQIGPVFGDRPTLFTLEHSELLRLVAYIHNNPVRAGLVDNPGGSTWSSHRCYLEPSRRPHWLQAERVLAACGLSDDEKGRAAFHQGVLQRVDADHGWFPEDTDLARFRAKIRSTSDHPVEIATPHILEEGHWEADLAFESNVTPHASWDGGIRLFIGLLEARTGLNIHQLRRGGRQRAVVKARRLALLTWVNLLRRPQRELARQLALSDGAASNLRNRNARQVEELSGDAQALAELCWKSQ